MSAKVNAIAPMAASNGSQILIFMKMAESGGVINVVTCGMDDKKDMYLVLSEDQYRWKDVQRMRYRYGPYLCEASTVSETMVNSIALATRWPPPIKMKREDSQMRRTGTRPASQQTSTVQARLRSIPVEKSSRTGLRPYFPAIEPTRWASIDPTITSSRPNWVVSISIGLVQVLRAVGGVGVAPSPPVGLQTYQLILDVYLMDKTASIARTYESEKDSGQRD
ncbi:MAG: hypothetical protein LQ345_002172 [Seirophora villosa]|nr:MAG: hypothetical protein LQ345_002172 [Seirophora villosa]